MEDKFRALQAENEDLKEVCLYLDQLHAAAGDVEVEPSPPSERPASKGLPLHVLCALELNEQLDAGVPRFRGATNVIALNDKRLPWQGQLQRLRGSDPEQCIEQLEQRIERLESEKLELSKSLSAAHLLGALPAQQKGEEMQTHLHDTLSPPMLAPETELEHPHHFQAFLQGRTPANTQSDNGHRMSDHSPSINSNSVLAAAVTQEICYLEEEKTGGSTRSPETIMCAVDLLDLCLRLDATEVELSADIQEEAENAMLRLLLDIAWKKVSEQSGT
ncbi:hypothetical protein EMCRGX_G032426 [Ephydatia muelleri]